MDKREKRKQRVSATHPAQRYHNGNDSDEENDHPKRTECFYPSRLFPLGRATGLRSGTIAPAEVGAFC